MKWVNWLTIEPNFYWSTKRVVHTHAHTFAIATFNWWQLYKWKQVPKKATFESYVWRAVKPNETEMALRSHTTFHEIYCTPINRAATRRSFHKPQKRLIFLDRLIWILISSIRFHNVSQTVSWSQTQRGAIRTENILTNHSAFMRCVILILYFCFWHLKFDNTSQWLGSMCESF